jgi:hypothetical protein
MLSINARIVARARFEPQSATLTLRLIGTRADPCQYMVSDTHAIPELSNMINGILQT